MGNLEKRNQRRSAEDDWGILNMQVLERLIGNVVKYLDKKKSQILFNKVMEQWTCSLDRCKELTRHSVILQDEYSQVVDFGKEALP